MWLSDGARDRSSAEGRPPTPARRATGGIVVAHTNRSSVESAPRRRREALNMKNKNLYAGVAAGFVSGKVVKSFAYSLVPVAAIGYVVMHAPEILAKLGFEKYAVMIEVWPRVW